MVLPSITEREDMAYCILKRTTKWSLVHRQYNGSDIVATRTIELGTPEADSLGVFRGMTFEAATAAVKLNRADGKARYHQERRARLAERAKARETATAAWIPASLIKEFEKERLPFIGGRRERWLIVKELLTKIDIAPYDWHWQPDVFWRHFQAKGWSIGYVRRLMMFVNKWGEFYCKKTGKQWTPVPKPTGTERSKIQLRHFEKKKHKATNEMTTEHLVTAQTKLDTQQLNALKLTFWCGLRKEEIDYVIANDPSNDTWYVDKDRRGFYVFHLFQDKLRRKGIEPRLCWKAVPLVEPEQEELVTILEKRDFKPIPLKKLKRIVGVTLTNRSARKGFSVEMEARGYSREYVNEWLGHVGTTTAARSYRNRRIAMYEPPVVWQSKKQTA
jgi:hypothetical protein